MEIRREARKVCCMLAAFLVLRAPGFVLCAARRSRMANIGAETKETKIPRLTKTSLERALMLGPTLTRRLWRGVAPKVWPRDAHRVMGPFGLSLTTVITTYASLHEQAPTLRQFHSRTAPPSPPPSATATATAA
jgi:hypothetical protein